MSAPVAMCQCGCGNPAPISRATRSERGQVKGQPVSFIRGHATRGRRLGQGRKAHAGYVLVRTPGHPRADVCGYVREHLLVVERALGRHVPLQHPVHHVNEDRSDNRPENLVLCENQLYHELLHVRSRALAACGEADWRRCKFCGRYDAPANLHIGTNSNVYHVACATRYSRLRYQAKRRAA